MPTKCFILQDFIGTLDEEVRKLAIRGLRRGIGSMDYIETLLIMEDDLDENQDDDLGEFGESSMTGNDNNDPLEQDSSTGWRKKKFMRLI